MAIPTVTTWVSKITVTLNLQWKSQHTRALLTTEFMYYVVQEFCIK